MGFKNDRNIVRKRAAVVPGHLFQRGFEFRRQFHCQYQTSSILFKLHIISLSENVYLVKPIIYVARKGLPVYSRAMSRDTYASVRLSTELKEKIREIAKIERRTLSSTIDLLLEKAVAAYKQDRTLIEFRTKRRTTSGTTPKTAPRRAARKVA